MLKGGGGFFETVYHSKEVGVSVSALIWDTSSYWKLLFEGASFSPMGEGGFCAKGATGKLKFC
jgi:hypothetical protein